MRSAGEEQDRETDSQGERHGQSREGSPASDETHEPDRRNQAEQTDSGDGDTHERNGRPEAAHPERSGDAVTASAKQRM